MIDEARLSTVIHPQGCRSIVSRVVGVVWIPKLCGLMVRRSSEVARRDAKGGVLRILIGPDGVRWSMWVVVTIAKRMEIMPVARSGRCSPAIAIDWSIWWREVVTVRHRHVWTVHSRTCGMIRWMIHCVVHGIHHR